MANIYDITIEQGTSFGITLTLTDATGAPLNLSGYTATGQIRYGYGSSGILAPLITEIDPSFVSGILNVSLDAAATATLPVTVAVYDVIVTNPIGDFTFKPIKGYANIYVDGLADVALTPTNVTISAVAAINQSEMNLISGLQAQIVALSGIVATVSGQSIQQI